MIKIIKSHNRLNGVKFCIIEFITVLVIAFSIAIYFLIHHLFLTGLIYFGIAVNCLPIVIIGVHTLMHCRTNLDNETIWNKKSRKRLRIVNPHMDRDTMILVITIALPFVNCLATLYEFSKNKNK